MRGSLPVQHLYDLTHYQPDQLFRVSNVDNSLAEILSFQHIHKRCSGRVNSFVDMFLGLDTAFNEPLQHDCQLNHPDLRSRGMELTCGTRSFLSLVYLGPKSGSVTKNPWNRMRLATICVRFLMGYRSSIRSGQSNPPNRNRKTYQLLNYIATPCQTQLQNQHLSSTETQQEEREKNIPIRPKTFIHSIAAANCSPPTFS